MTAQPTDDPYEYTFVGDLRPGDEVRTHGVVDKIELGTLTNTVYFKSDGDEYVGIKCRTWHSFHSVEIKKRSQK